MGEVGKIHARISAIMDEIGAIGKNHTNDRQGYSFRGIDDVYAALQPRLRKHKVFVVPEVIEHKSEIVTTDKVRSYVFLRVKFYFTAEDGSAVVVTTCGEGMDFGDKATYKAMSGAFKYAVIQLFCIPTGEKIDAEFDSPERGGKKSDAKPEVDNTCPF